MSKRQSVRVSRVAQYFEARYREAAGQPDALRDAAWSDLRAAIKRLPAPEAKIENERLSVLLQRRAAELRRGGK